MPDDNETPSEAASKAARAESVSRQLNDEEAPVTELPNPDSESDPAPGTEDVGDSVTRHGESIVGNDGKEAGSHDVDTDSPTGRPAGTSDPRYVTGVNPTEN